MATGSGSGAAGVSRNHRIGGAVGSATTTLQPATESNIASVVMNTSPLPTTLPLVGKPSVVQNDDDDLAAVVASVSGTVAPPSVVASSADVATPTRPPAVSVRSRIFVPSSSSSAAAQVIDPTIIEDIRVVGDQIGQSFMAVDGGDEWESFQVDMARIFARPETLNWPKQIPLANANDFWERARGDWLLAQEAADDASTCDPALSPRGGAVVTRCEAIMMLISNMPLPQEKDDFFRHFGISDFINTNILHFVAKLQTERNRLAYINGAAYNYVPERLLGRIDARQHSWINEFSVNWAIRFPEIFENRDDLLQTVVKHGLLRMVSDPRAAATHGGLSQPVEFLDIDRNRALATSTYYLLNSDPSAIRSGIYQVGYANEPARGGGLIAEWFALFNQAIVGPVFKPVGDDADIATLDKVDLDRNIFVEHLVAVGRYFALCIISGRPTSLRLPLGFFKVLLRENPSLEDIREVDPARFNYYRDLVADTLTQERLDQILDTMMTQGEPLEFADSTEPLTIDNRHEQVGQAVRNILINSSPIAVERIAQGLEEIIPREYLTLSADQLRKLICSTADIDAAEFIANMDFVNNWLPNRADWFRRIVGEFNQERLRNLLRFITGFQVLPGGGFPAMGRIRISAHYSDHYPTAHTCFKSLDMPQYGSFEEMREILTNVVDRVNFVGMSETR